MTLFDITYVWDAGKNGRDQAGGGNALGKPLSPVGPSLPLAGAF
jgi:hypothetical protein